MRGSLTAGEVIVTAGSVARTFSATTSTGVIMFDLTTLVRSCEESTISMTIRCARGSEWGSAEEDFLLFNGRTLAGRYHASESVVCVPKDMGVQMPQLFLPNKANVNGTNTNLGITTATFPAHVRMLSDHEYLRGDIMCPDTSTEYDVIVREECVPANGIFLTYTNTDGVLRYAVGRIRTSTMGAERATYTTNDDEVRNRPAHVIFGASEEITVDFINVPHGQYLEDILLSDEVIAYNGTVVAPVIPVDSSIIRKVGASDYTITFKLS